MELKWTHNSKQNDHNNAHGDFNTPTITRKICLFYRHILPAHLVLILYFTFILGPCIIFFSKIRYLYLLLLPEQYNIVQGERRQKTA